MNKKKDINKNVAAKKQLGAEDLHKQIQKIAEENNLEQRFFNISFEKQTQSNNDSVELKKTSKGVTWSIKCYGKSQEAMKRANEIFDECNNLYGELENESQ